MSRPDVPGWQKGLAPAVARDPVGFANNMIAEVNEHLAAADVDACLVALATLHGGARHVAEAIITDPGTAVAALARLNDAADQWLEHLRAALDREVNQ